MGCRGGTRHDQPRLQPELGCKSCEQNPYISIQTADKASDSIAVGAIARIATASLWGLLQTKRVHRGGDCCKQSECIAVGTVASKATAWLWGLLQAKRLHRGGDCCKQSECIAVGTVASKATAWLWGLLQAKRLHRCGDGCKQSDCIAVGTVASKATASVLALLQAAAIAEGALLQSYRRHRCCPFFRGIKHEVAVTIQP